VADLAAAVGWGFGIWHSGEAVHQQILSLEVLPLILLALHRFGETRRGRFLLAVFFAWLVQEFLSEYWAAFLVLLIAPFALLLLRMTYRLPWRAVAGAFAVIGLAVLPWLVVQRPLLAGSGTGGHRHTRGEIMSHSADLSDYLPPSGTMLWGWLETYHPAPAGSGAAGEASVSPGFILLALACAGMLSLVLFERKETISAPAGGIWSVARRVGPYGLAGGLLFWAMMRVLDMDVLPLPGPEGAFIPRSFFSGFGAVSLCLWLNAPLRTALRRYRLSLRDARSPLVPYAALALLAMIWSCGYTVNLYGHRIAPGIHELFAYLPGANGFRVLLRMGAIADLALTVIGACTLVDLARGSARLRSLAGWKRGGLAVLVCALILLENVPRAGTAFRRSRVNVPRPRAADRWLAAQPPGPVLELPLTVSPLAEGQRLWYQLAHRMPMVNGAETFFRERYYDDVHVFATPGSPAALARMRDLHLRYIVLDHRNSYTGSDTFLGVVPSMPDALPPPLAPRYRDATVSIYETPRPWQSAAPSSGRPERALLPLEEPAATGGRTRVRRTVVAAKVRYQVVNRAVHVPDDSAPAREPDGAAPP
jgi:hypothetical protein